MNKLFKLTPLEDSFSCNFNILVNGVPQVLGVKGILDAWIDFRMQCIRRQTAFDIQKKSERLHLLEGLNKILLDIDKAIRIIRGTEKEEQVVPNLMKGFSIDEAQAEFIAEIKLRNLNREYIINKVSEIKTLRSEISVLKDIYGKESKILEIICRQLGEISKKYGQPRKTGIISEANVDEITEEVLIEDYNVKLFLTAQGYLKRSAYITALGRRTKTERDDVITRKLRQEQIRFNPVSTGCVVYKLKVHEINDCKASTLGEYLGNILDLNEEEKITYIVATEDYSGHMLFSYKNGKCAKIPLNSYATKTNRRKLINAYSGLSPVCNIRYLQQDTELVAFSDIGKVLVFNTSAINEKTTRNSAGVQVLKQKKGSSMVKIKDVSEVSVEDVDYYRTKNIPAVGRYLKEEDKEDRQITLF